MSEGATPTWHDQPVQEPTPLGDQTGAHFLRRRLFCFPSENARAECPQPSPNPIFYMAVHTAIMQALQ
jgi:hypothetical protein